MNIVLTGGGTAGHITPNLALVNELNKSFDRIYYLGNKNGMEYKLTKNYNLKFLHIDSIKFDRQHILKNISIPFVLPKYIRHAKGILKNRNISVVFSKGGYVSLPVVLAAKMLNIPVICHESDLTLGLTNRITSKFADLVITSYKETKRKSNFEYIGMPLRDEILNPCEKLIYTQYGISKNTPILLIVGGSLGAKVINNVIYESLEELTKHYFVIHIQGKGYKTIQHKNYIQLEYVNNIQDYIAAATLIISRCGATFANEIAALNKKVLFIPLENASSRGDQVENAKYFEKKNLSLTLYERDLNKDNLLIYLNNLMQLNKAPYYYDTFINEKIVSRILCILDKHI